jgi:hypothetical protein
VQRYKSTKHVNKMPIITFVLFVIQRTKLFSSKILKRISYLNISLGILATIGVDMVVNGFAFVIRLTKLNRKA